MTAIAHASAELASHVANRLTRTIERICALPGVATPHWCERAAEAVLPLASDEASDAGRAPSSSTAGAAFVCLADCSLSPNGPLRSIEAGVAGFKPAAGRAFLNHRFTHIVGGKQAIERPPMRRLKRCEFSGNDVLVASLTPDAAVNADEARDVDPCRLAWSGAGVSRVVAALVELDDARLLLEVGVRRKHAPAVAVAESALASAACAVARRASVAFSPSARANGERITQREEEVLDLLIHGLSVQEIARKLCRSPHTIHDHVKSLHRKVGASSRGELVARALGSDYSTRAPPPV